MQPIPADGCFLSGNSLAGITGNTVRPGSSGAGQRWQAMARRSFGPLDWLLHRRSLVAWRTFARGADTAELGDLRRQRTAAQALSTEITRLIHVADERLALPRIGTTSFPRPPGTDWAWRPALWRGPLLGRGLAGVESRTAVGEDVMVFHDCKVSEITIRQLRNTREEDLAPFALRLDVFRFDGSFLSLVMDLPAEACHGLTNRHILRVGLRAEVEKPVEIFARINIQHGPNTEQIVRQVPIAAGPEAEVEFDLGYSNLNERRIEKAWLDLIFEGPEMNQITMRDLTFARYFRAEL
jgi:hypothetical protein